MKSYRQRIRALFLSLFSISSLLFNSVQAQNFPPITFVVKDSAATQGYYFISPYTSYATTIYDRPHLILDRFGRIVFYQIFPQGVNAIPTIDFKLQPNGWMSYYDINRGKFYFMDSTFMRVDSIACAHGFETDQHDVQLLPNNHYLLFGVEYRVMNLTSYHWFGFNHNQPGSANALVGGVVIQEFDQDKDLVWEWKGHDHFQFGDVDPVWLSNPNKVDWTHANAVEQDHDGNVLLSMRHFNEITKINRETGDIIWRLGGKMNQFTFPNDPVRFTGQHDIRRVSDTSVSLFDNGQYSNPSSCRALEYALDEQNRIATLVWEYIFDSSLYSVACGNHHYAGNGNHLVDFGFTNNFAMPWMAVVKPDKSKVIEVSMPNGFISYRAFNYTSLPWQLNRPQVWCRKTGNDYFLEAEPGHAEYRWSTGASTPVIPITDTGTYYVFVPYGLGYLSSEYIRIDDLTAPCLPTPVAGKNTPGIMTLNLVTDQADKRLKLYFNLPDPSSLTFSAVSLHGTTALPARRESFSRGKHETALDLSPLAPGMYLLVVIAGDERIVRKFVVQ